MEGTHRSVQATDRERLFVFSVDSPNYVVRLSNPDAIL